ncbi:MAG: NADH-quinone oxidoreductase subunit NuoE [Anaerolineae bacterium]|nr:NADH-quinone oxidoreductase subunit NuoE [Anaerolineae bacterium]
MKAETTVDLAPLEGVFARHGEETGALIPVLQGAQEAYGYLPREVLEAVAARLGLPLSRVYGVVTFYSQFYLSPRGRHVIRCCDGTACHVRGTPKIVQALENLLGIGAGETTDDHQFTLEVVYCLGSCALAPVAVVDGRVMGGMTPEKMVQVVRELDGTGPGQRT